MSRSTPLHDKALCRLEAPVIAEPYQGARPFMLTTYERGRIDARPETALMQLETEFGPLPAEVTQRVGSLSPEQLFQLLVDLAKDKSLKELRLID
jgi:hypothetical protein